MIPGQLVRMKGKCSHGYHPSKCPRHGNGWLNCCQHPDPRECYHGRTVAVRQEFPGNRVMLEWDGHQKTFPVPERWIVRNPSGYIRLMRPAEMEEIN